ncbi:MAG: hypothetical protein IKR67_06540 [Lachnospiraceae bacterium]|nr:hypothetical protein [Lachnospiraceae bacterium]
MNVVERGMRKILNSVFGIILFMVSLIAFYLPYEIEIIPEVISVLPWVRYICGGLLIIAFFILYCSSLTVFRNNWYLMAAILFLGVLCYSTYLNGADMTGFLGKKALTALFFIIDIAVFFRTNMKRYLLMAFFWFLLVNIANTFTVFYYWGEGLWETWQSYRSPLYSLVGNYNGGVEFVLPMAICGSAWAHRYGKWLDIINYLAMIMSMLMALKCDSLTQQLVYGLIIVFMLLGNIAMLSKGFTKFLQILHPILMVCINFAAFVLFVVLNKASWLEKIGIDANFHNRRHVWDMAIEWIKARPLLGSGLETVDMKASKIVGYAHCHCWYLEIPYMTGIAGSVAALLMIIAVIVSIMRLKHGRLTYILSVMLFVFGLSLLMESYGVPYFIVALGLIYYIAKNGSEDGARKKVVRREA